ncbi:hypothetical protein [Catellatospora bangladeshensis]|uniref:Uncharacterized protein n=2 Tax=Catellatospora bangladeshensis TaxID=310355 RepID=A0A8J3JKU0_9ACTN|nr:hypothetical protein [Catellatospora bangladeshensis]GIF82471.1 hypothetical protein Cba03nite_38200 [Catellatospora bangladeshensis]
MTDELAARVDALADEMAEQRTALSRATPGQTRLDVPGRMAALARTADTAAGARWSGHVAAAGGFDARLRDLAASVRTAGRNYREADEHGGVA